MRTLCPSWSFASRSCLVRQDTLYLPLEEHVDIYCEGGAYSSCPQCTNVSTSPPPLKDGSVERRNVKRTPIRRVTTIVKGIAVLENQAVTGAAVTVDVSKCGLRLEICQALVKGSAIQLSVDWEESAEPVYCDGVVQWCNLTRNSSLFHAGIRLTDAVPFEKIHHQIEKLCSLKNDHI